MWILCDSHGDLESRAKALGGGVRRLPAIKTDDSNTWGYFLFPGEVSTILPIGYADVGLSPELYRKGSFVLVGVAEVVARVDLDSAQIVFQYKMPTIFHEFVRVTDGGILIRDEIGFVLLSPSGQELWKFCVDIISDFELKGNQLSITTIDGESFTVKVP